jgi:hypothetical protein
MSTICRPILVFAVAACLCTGGAKGQDSPPLGDLARQQRQQKEQSKTAQGKDAKASKVITNEEIPEHGNASAPAGSSQAIQSSTSESSGGTKQQAEHVKSQILAQKTQIATLQGQVDELNESIRFAPANCVENCVGWNERQREKQQRAERMQSQLEEEKRRLEDMQDSARKQGFGSSVYDP